MIIVGLRIVSQCLLELIDPLFPALPFYWLGQIAVLAFQEGIPPFMFGAPSEMVPEARFRLVKQWLKHIRGFLKAGDTVQTTVWDELMNIRMETWRAEAAARPVVDEEVEGLISFFDKTL